MDADGAERLLAGPPEQRLPGALGDTSGTWTALDDLATQLQRTVVSEGPARTGTVGAAWCCGAPGGGGRRLCDWRARRGPGWRRGDGQGPLGHPPVRPPAHDSPSRFPAPVGDHLQKEGDGLLPPRPEWLDVRGPAGGEAADVGPSELVGLRTEIVGFVAPIRSGTGGRPKRPRRAGTTRAMSGCGWTLRPSRTVRGDLGVDLRRQEAEVPGGELGFSGDDGTEYVTTFPRWTRSGRPTGRSSTLLSRESASAPRVCRLDHAGSGAGSGARSCKAEEGVDAERRRLRTTPQMRAPDPRSTP